MKEQKQDVGNGSVKLALGLGFAVIVWYVLAMLVVLR